MARRPTLADILVSPTQEPFPWPPSSARASICSSP